MWWLLRFGKLRTIEKLREITGITGAGGRLAGGGGGSGRDGTFAGG